MFKIQIQIQCSNQIFKSKTLHSNLAYIRFRFPIFVVLIEKKVEV